MNKLTQHTPGPWEVREAYDNGEPCGYVVQSGVNAIADVPQGEADALLIASAPDLLAACMDTVAMLESPKFKEWIARHRTDDEFYAMAGAMSQRADTLNEAVARAKGAA